MHHPGAISSILRHSNCCTPTRLRTRQNVPSWRRCRAWHGPCTSLETNTALRRHFLRHGHGCCCCCLRPTDGSVAPPSSRHFGPLECETHGESSTIDNGDGTDDWPLDCDTTDDDVASQSASRTTSSYWQAEKSCIYPHGNALSHCQAASLRGSRSPRWRSIRNPTVVICKYAHSQ